MHSFAVYYYTIMLYMDNVKAQTFLHTMHKGHTCGLINK
jgi:hypothetical protein